MKLVTVAETDEFARKAKSLLSEEERAALTDYLSAHPDAGTLLGGGVRKFRFARSGAGKSGGFRVIHFFQEGSGTPLFLITIFAKNVQENLSPAQASNMAKVGEALASSYRRKQ